MTAPAVRRGARPYVAGGCRPRAGLVSVRAVSVVLGVLCVLPHVAVAQDSGVLARVGLAISDHLAALGPTRAGDEVVPAGSRTAAESALFDGLTLGVWGAPWAPAPSLPQGGFPWSTGPSGVMGFGLPRTGAVPPLPPLSWRHDAFEMQRRLDRTVQWRFRIQDQRLEALQTIRRVHAREMRFAADLAMRGLPGAGWIAFPGVGALGRRTVLNSAIWRAQSRDMSPTRLTPAVAARRASTAAMTMRMPVLRAPIQVGQATYGGMRSARILQDMRRVELHRSTTSTTRWSIGGRGWQAMRWEPVRYTPPRTWRGGR